MPDHVVRAADQIELVDMSPQALRRRMAHGNIYTAEKVDAALSNYFREGNLTALRELALLWLADRVDEGLDRYRDQHDIQGTWATRERIVVAVTGGPESSTLMRRAARIATPPRPGASGWRSTSPATTASAGSPPTSSRPCAPRPRSSAAPSTPIVGDDASEAILEFAKAENATQVIDRRQPARPGLHGATTRDRRAVVIAASGDIDVHIVTHDYVAPAQPARDQSGQQARRTPTRLSASCSRCSRPRS